MTRIHLSVKLFLITMRMSGNRISYKPFVTINRFLCEILGSHGGEYEDYRILGLLQYTADSAVRTATIIRPLRMEAVRTSETSVYFNETTPRYISEGSNLLSISCYIFEYITRTESVIE
jgi:hypothetical protein